MTGTAETELTEFNNIYDLSVQVVPTNRDVQREDSQDVVFRSESGKWAAVRREIARMHKKGRPCSSAPPPSSAPRRSAGCSTRRACRTSS